MQEEIRLITPDTTSPYFNLAAEEYLLQHTDEEIIMLWQNSNTIVVGRHQNTLAEINTEYVESRDVKVVRRLTGGGAVFHDMGNLNFTFIRNRDEKDEEIDFSGFLEPIIDALHKLGVPAEFSGRNDIVVEGRKISGNAMAYYRNRVLEHGTLLFSSVQENIAAALKADPDKFSDKAVKSVRKRVANISDYIKEPMDISEFKRFLTECLATAGANVWHKDFTHEEKAVIELLAQTKYSTWEWNFGNSPKYGFERKVKTQGGIIQSTVDVKDGRIEDVRFYGDFFGVESPDILAEKLVGTAHEKNAIERVISGTDLCRFFSKATADDILYLLSPE